MRHSACVCPICGHDERVSMFRGPHEETEQAVHPVEQVLVRNARKSPLNVARQLSCSHFCRFKPALYPAVVHSHGQRIIDQDQRAGSEHVQGTPLPKAIFLDCHVLIALDELRRRCLLVRLPSPVVSTGWHSIGVF
jgi:hypothetical protein